MSGVIFPHYCDEGRWVSVLPRKIYVWSLAYATVVALGNPYCLRLPALVLVNNRDVLLRLACRGVDTPLVSFLHPAEYTELFVYGSKFYLLHYHNDIVNLY
uniref:Very-long-chain 3-oxoacyl-CoA synthase n=1 Tax=Heterorhabditis bacteriophora TaxID=37862 RepID=A0A1I7X2W5_HETBA